MRNPYDEFPEEYARSVRGPDEWGFSVHLEIIIPALLDAAGDVRGLNVLDACCGDGYLTQLIAARGAHMTGIDISPRLIAAAREKEEQERRGIVYQVHDLTERMPEYEHRFDLITCNLALDDVPDYRALIENFADMLRRPGRLVLTFNNPYSAVMRELVSNYFDSGQAAIRRGMKAAGVPAVHYHRPLEDYMREFKRHGLLIRTLLDLRPSAEQLSLPSPRPRSYYFFPRLMLLELVAFQ
ncbi:MAG: class I SAM-dependent DNA methyltransferase [Rudaea sp.]